MSKPAWIILFLCIATIAYILITGCTLLDKVCAWIPVCPPTVTPTPAEAPSVPTVTPAPVIATPTPAAIRTPTPLPASNPSIIGQISRVGRGWGGGVEYYQGLIIETAVSSSGGCADIIFRDPAQGGAVIKTITGPYDKGYHDCAYDSKRNLLWLTCWGGNLIAIPVTGGAAVKSYGHLSQHKYGVFYDASEDCLWIALHVDGKLVKINPDTGAVLQEIPVSQPFGSNFQNWPSGVIKIGSAFWVTIQGEDGYAGWLYQIGMNGKPTGRQMRMPAATYANGVGGLTLDPEGFLWVKGGKGTAIYKVQK